MNHDVLPPLPIGMARLLPDPEVARWLALIAARLAVVEALGQDGSPGSLMESVRAELAALEGVDPEWVNLATSRVMHQIREHLRAVVAADPAEWSCRDCGATGSLSDSVTHRCVVAVVAADPADTEEKITRRLYLLTKAMETGASNLVVMEAVASTAIEHPEWDMEEKRTWEEWEKIGG
jgi:hypothetical protein